MARCFYCGKKSFRGINWPLHPRDGTGNCCEECWRSRVADVGLTKATGDLKLDKAAIVAYGNKGYQCYDRGDFEEALANLDKCIELSLKSKFRGVHYSWLFGRGMCHMRLGHMYEAKLDIGWAGSLFEKQKTSVGSFGDLLKSGARGESSWDYYISTIMENLRSYNPQACARACSLLDEIVETYDLEGSACEELRQGLEKGLYMLPLEKGIILHGGVHILMWELKGEDPVRYLTYLGLGHILLGRYKKAIDYLEQLTKADPTNAGAYYFLGSARIKQCDENRAKGGIFLKRKLRTLKSKAKNDFLTALSLSPNRSLVSQIEKQIKTLGEPPLTTRYMHAWKRANCTRCGAELKPNAKFCHKCGQTLQVEGQARAQTEEMSGKKEWGKDKIVIIRPQWTKVGGKDKIVTLRWRVKTLKELEDFYRTEDYSSRSFDDLAAILKVELRWFDTYADLTRYDTKVKQQYDIHKIAVRRIGEELNRRGGFKLMQQMFHHVNGDATLEMLWKHIGRWMGH